MKYFILFCLAIILQIMCDIFPSLDFILNCVGVLICLTVILKFEALARRVNNP